MSVEREGRRWEGLSLSVAKSYSRGAVGHSLYESQGQRTFRNNHIARVLMTSLQSSCEKSAVATFPFLGCLGCQAFISIRSCFRPSLKVITKRKLAEQDT